MAVDIHGSVTPASSIVVSGGGGVGKEYSFSIEDHTITITDSGGGVQTIVVPTDWTEAQIKALIEGYKYATTEYVDQHHDDNKQDKLTAGTNISIENNTISATSDSTKQDKLIAGDNITIAEDGKTISATGGSADDKMDKENPTGTGSFSLNRLADSIIGDYSFAEGINCVASGRAAHAEGEVTKSLASKSHAEGSRTTASKTCSHAEGYLSEANGEDSHAEGYYSIASGMASHAEGGGSKATSSYSHAEGASIAAGIASHAEGSHTKASSECQHTQGKYNIEDTSDAYSDIVGNGTADDARSNASTLDWSGNAWFAGDVYVGSTSGTNKDDGSVKLAKSTDKLANPYKLTIDGTEYDGSSEVSVTTGGSADDKMDKENPTGTGSFSLNRLADSTVGDYSFAEGYNTKASGKYSHAEGYGTNASGVESHAEGYNTTASGGPSHAEGSNTTASGNYSHAEGSYTTASKDCTHAEGSSSSATGSYSHAEGYACKATGNTSHAEGGGTIAASGCQHAQGKNNIEDSDGVYAFIIGNGATDRARSNASTLDWSGNAWFSGDVYVGSTSGTNKDDGSKKLITMDDVINKLTELGLIT